MKGDLKQNDNMNYNMTFSDPVTMQTLKMVYKTTALQ